MGARGWSLVAALGFVCVSSCGGGDDPPGDADGGDADTDADADGGTDADTDGDTEVVTSLAFESPIADASLIGSAVVYLLASEDIDSVEVSIEGEEEPRCEIAAQPFQCLVDLAEMDAGAFSLTARGLSGDEEIATARVDVEKRAAGEDVCPDGTWAMDCVQALVTAGTAAGWEGISYHDMDNGHAPYDTSAMAGIEVKIDSSFAGQDEWHSDEDRILIGNQSEAYIGGTGSASIPRLRSVTEIESLWEESKFFLWPEHRDHGYADFYAWQSPSLVFSQGSSGSELDEVGKLLHAVGAFPSDLRAEMHAQKALMPALTMIHRRARVATDTEYLAAQAHPAAFNDAASDNAGVRLVRAIEPGEIPPVAKLSAQGETIPADWGVAAFGLLEYGPYSATWAAEAQPPSDLGGTFEVVVDLVGSVDANDRALYYFASVVRGDPARVEVTQLDRTRFEVVAEWPSDYAQDVGGQSRTSRRTTVAFFAHNGAWLSAPVFLSLFGSDPYAWAPDSNNLD